MAGYPTKGKTINGWTLYVHKVTGQTTISVSGSGLIDELRLYPAKAQMATYTFEPLVGMTSSCDAGNRITYYEYDGLQRLRRIRDQDYNIIKSIEYQYQGTSGCGSNCYILTMQTLAGTNTLGYPVGVFNVHGKLLGNAAGASQYVALWNNDTADSRIGTLGVGGDSLHFNISLNSGQSLPSAVTGCRYYQVDLAWNVFDGVRNSNAAYVDFGDSIGIRLPASVTEVAATIPSRTTYAVIFDGEAWANVPYYVHTYPDTTLKTLTFYHNDDALNDHLDNLYGPATSLTKLMHFRGNLPQNLAVFGGSSYQGASMNSVDSIYNWNSIHSITYINILGDFVNPSKGMAYAQDFMRNNKGLRFLKTTNSYYRTGYRDTTFRISRLKSDWNTYFTELQTLRINEEHWNHEDLSALKKLNFFQLVATTQNHQDDPNSPLVPIASSVLNAVLNQIAAGAGQTVSNGYIVLDAGGGTPSNNSTPAVQFLLSKGWTIYINGVLQTNP
jgi:YD repeat-containing protein